MTGNTHHIIKHLFKADSIESVSAKQAEDLSNQYPFFNVGHYLLSKKLRTKKEESFLDVTKKTALYFTNPYWLQWLLENSTDEKPLETKTSSIQEIKKQAVFTKQPFANINTGKSENIQVPEKIVSNNDEQLFEPYHTVDYFASQGIKFDAELQANDRFGMQLKSFTQWLRVMKKLPQKSVEENIGTAEQAAIDGFAAHSIQQKEVLTEAMAEVLAKQGKNEDAIRLYKKLSLINPFKSAYFAAKIEQLNSY